MRRVISYITHPGHNLDVSTSVIVASETCLCLKSYLVGSWIWVNQIWHSVCQIGSTGMGNHVRWLAIYSMSSVTCHRWTKSEGTRGRFRGRHLGWSVWKQWKLLEGLVFDLSLLIQLWWSNTCSSRLDPDPIRSCGTLTPYRSPHQTLNVTRKDSMVWWTRSYFLLFYPTSFPHSLSFALDSLLFGLLIFLTHTILLLLLLIIALY